MEFMGKREVIGNMWNIDVTFDKHPEEALYVFALYSKHCSLNDTFCNRC